MTAFYPLQITELKHDTRDMLVVRFDAPENLREIFHYRPGQHLVLRQNIEGVEYLRQYSICASKNAQILRIGIKKIAGGVFSNWAFDRLQIGSVIDVSPPVGKYGWPHLISPQNYLMIAVGSGITPILSLMTSILEGDETSQITLIYGNRNTESVVFGREIAALKEQFTTRFTVIYIMSREKQEIDAFNGRINSAKLMHLCHKWVNLPSIHQAFLCGPATMMEEAVMALRTSGLAPEHIQREIFIISNQKKIISSRTRHADAPDATSHIDFTINGIIQNVTAQNRNQSLLDIALAHGFDISHSCKSGVCASCRCKILDGKVDMDAGYGLEDYEIARGFVLSCQAYPVSDKITVDFDCG
ncbi:MAG: 2Fe-2S iron-sulfur cluster-binding protein [Alphaproteobacteria bacterium]|nr:2Fe-2S iron-sulfur cluster-binding protein [Alphaproteobacteria bacterium]